jgi:surface antigen
VSRAVKPLVLLLLAVAAATAVPPSLARSSGAILVYGYPYASRCPAAGYNDEVDRWGMDMCNCTSYVAWALRANGQRTDWFIPGAMDAWNWPHVARLSHLSVSRRPRVRAVAVWPKVSLPFGHVAYVTGVERNREIDVSEYNGPGTRVFDPFVFDTRRNVSTDGAVFIYVGARRQLHT